MLLAPEGAAGLHLKALARASRLFKDTDFRARLLSEGSAPELWSIIRERMRGWPSSSAELMHEVRVKEFIELVKGPLGLEVCAGMGTDALSPIRVARIQKPGLALAGYSAFVHPIWVQVLGQTEIPIFPPWAPRRARSRRVDADGAEFGLPLGHQGLGDPQGTPLAGCDQTNTPLLRTRLVSGGDAQGPRLPRRFPSPRTSVHGLGRRERRGRLD